MAASFLLWWNDALVPEVSSSKNTIFYLFRITLLYEKLISEC